MQLWVGSEVLSKRVDSVEVRGVVCGSGEGVDSVDSVEVRGVVCGSGEGVDSVEVRGEVCGLAESGLTTVTQKNLEPQEFYHEKLQGVLVIVHNRPCDLSCYNW